MMRTQWKENQNCSRVRDQLSRFDATCGSAEISRNLALIIHVCPSLSIQAGETATVINRIIRVDTGEPFSSPLVDGGRFAESII
jgi:hypothetical protein